MTNKLFIGNLLEKITNSQLLKYFSKAGEVLSAKIIKDKNGLSTGYAFVDMVTNEGADNAKKTLNHTEIEANPIKTGSAEQIIIW